MTKDTQFGLINQIKKTNIKKIYYISFQSLDKSKKLRFERTQTFKMAFLQQCYWLLAWNILQHWCHK